MYVLLMLEVFVTGRDVIKSSVLEIVWVVMPRLHESGPFQGSYGQARETTQHLLGPI